MKNYIHIFKWLLALLAVALFTGASTVLVTLQVDSSGNLQHSVVVPSGITITTSGSGSITATAAPAGSTGDFQYNNSGALGGRTPAAGFVTFFETATSANLASLVTDEVGSGKLVFSAGTLNITTAKTLAVTNSLTLAGTDSTTMTFPATNASIARIDTGQTFVGTNAFGVLTATSFNGNTFTTGTGTLTLGAGKVATISNTLTFTGTDSSSVAFGAGGTVVYSGGSAGALSGTTASVLDNSTKFATTAYADRAAVVRNAPVDLGNLTGTININWALGQFFYGVLTGNTTFTFSNGSSGQVILVNVAQTGTNTYTVTWPTMKWPAGTAPTMTTGTATSDAVSIYDLGGVFKGFSTQDIR